MVLTSFKTNGEALHIPPTILPEQFVTQAYTEILGALPFATVYMNTIISTVITTVGQVLFCSMAAYAFARIDFPFKNIIFVLVLSVLMVPGQIFLIPQYTIVQKLGLLDTIPALFLPNLFSAFGTFLLRQFFMSLPKELEEAAVLDGCSRYQIFGQIMLPLVKPGIVALVIFTAKFAWNELYVATDRQHLYGQDDTWSCTFHTAWTVHDPVPDADGRRRYGGAAADRTVLHLPETVYRRCCTVRY